MRPDRAAAPPRPPEIPRGASPGAMLRHLVRHPWSAIVWRWNYKAAVTSSIIRSALFFTTNLPVGMDAAWAALVTEFIYRFITAGFYGALTQAFRHVRPARAGTVTAMILLPLLGHSVELLVHWTRGTARLQESILASIALTCVTTAFNLFAMRRGALIIGEGSRSLLHDLARMPALLAAFLLSWRSRRFI